MDGAVAVRLPAVIRSAFFVASVTLAGCGVPSKDELPGVYIIKYEFGSERLHLRSDGSFNQALILGEGRTDSLTIAGKWEYANRDGSVEIRPGIMACDGFGHLKSNFDTPQDRLVVGYAKMRFGTMSIVQNEDLNLSYVKTDEASDPPGNESD